jgi:hypothetical protein
MDLIKLKCGSNLWEARPDLFPEGYETPIIRELWTIYFENRK